MVSGPLSLLALYVTSIVVARNLLSVLPTKSNQANQVKSDSCSLYNAD